MSQLPNWEECKQKIESEETNPIERFIFNNEPAGNEAEKTFRHELSELIFYVEEQCI